MSSQLFVPTDTAVSGTTDVSLNFSVIRHPSDYAVVVTHLFYCLFTNDDIYMYAAFTISTVHGHFRRSSAFVFLW